MASHKQLLLSVAAVMLCQHAFCVRHRLRTQRQSGSEETDVEGERTTIATATTTTIRRRPRGARPNQTTMTTTTIALESPSDVGDCGVRRYISEDGESFTIGEGVKYKANFGENLTSCEVKEGANCNSPLTLPWQKLTKVAKLQASTFSEKKLCCKVQKCTWRPQEHKFEVMTKSDDMQLAPLTEFTEKRVTGNTCMCCKEKNVPWTSDVNKKCMLAYEPDEDDLAGYTVGAVFSFGASDIFFKERCKKYCKHFPGYDVAKKSIRARKWQ